MNVIKTNVWGLTIEEANNLTKEKWDAFVQYLNENGIEIIHNDGWLAKFIGSQEHYLCINLTESSLIEYIYSPQSLVDILMNSAKSHHQLMFE